MLDASAKYGSNVPGSRTQRSFTHACHEMTTSAAWIEPQARTRTK